MKLVLIVFISRHNRSRMNPKRIFLVVVIVVVVVVMESCMVDNVKCNLHCYGNHLILQIRNFRKFVAYKYFGIFFPFYCFATTLHNL